MRTQNYDQQERHGFFIENAELSPVYVVDERNRVRLVGGLAIKIQRFDTSTRPQRINRMWDFVSQHDDTPPDVVTILEAHRTLPITRHEE